MKVAIAGGALAGGLFGVLLDRIAFWPLRARQAGSLAPLISSIAVGMIYVAFANGYFGPDVRHFPFDIVRTPVITVGPATFTVMQLTIFLTSLALMAGLQLLLRRSRLGAAIRAGITLGRSAAVLGLGVIGQFALRCLIAAGSRYSCFTPRVREMFFSSRCLIFAARATLIFRARAARRSSGHERDAHADQDPVVQ